MRPDANESKALGDAFSVRQDFHLTVGKEYLAIGVQFHVDAPGRGTGVWAHIISDFGNLTWAPLTLFEIVEGTVSRYWRARSFEHGLTLWPELLYEEFFHDELSEGDPPAVAAFKELIASLEAEASGHLHHGVDDNDAPDKE